MMKSAIFPGTDDMRERLGQHFLKNQKALSMIASSISAPSHAAIIEIGPGHGELTRHIIRLHPQSPVILAEKDQSLAAGLLRSLRDFKQVHIVSGDVRETLPAVMQTMQDDDFCIVGNIPYYLSGELVRMLGSHPIKPAQCVFTVQKEVADRVSAQPPKMNRMAASVQWWADVQVLMKIPPSDFTPPPQVDSAVVKFERLTTPRVFDLQAYDFCLEILFRQPRKTTLNSIVDALPGIPRTQIASILRMSGLDERVRSQNLSIGEMAKLSGDVAPLMAKSE
jgi:16S rRNA (adenine1518-N6/adenine1519-N6)-dimethyltransferase